MCSIEWCYFQWLTLNDPNYPNPPFFDILFRLSYLHSEWR